MSVLICNSLLADIVFALDIDDCFINIWTSDKTLRKRLHEGFNPRW